MQTTLPKVDYDTAREDGTVTNKDGYHQPPAGFGANCGCRLDTGKGAYRDVSVRMEGADVDTYHVHFYHQSPVVVEVDGRFRLDSCGYRTSSTKKRINRHTPAGYRVIQRDYEWFLETPDGRRDFEDGMVIEP